ncbi:Mitotic spindle checkpoint component mad2 [Ascosphaera pollenicola]|nr:Mitotic spindle checkpoint component mad2 [Ascosphaera pollenicola]
MNEVSEAASQVPTSREFVTLIVRRLSRIGEEAQLAETDPGRFIDQEDGSENGFSNVLKELPAAALSEVKPLLLTLHSIFPSELLLALDILDRRQIKRVTFPTEGDENVDRERPVYMIGSKSPTNKRYLPREEQDIVCLDSWNCSCPAFTVAALSDPIPASMGSDDETQHYVTNSPLSPDSMFGGMMPASVSLAELPTCKHLLACVLANQCDALFGRNTQTLRISKAEAAARWGNVA